MVEAEGPSFQEELLVFRKVQKSLQAACDDSDHPACIWYSLLDIQFIRFIKDGLAPNVPFDL
jgi:hypothetical protein